MIPNILDNMGGFYIFVNLNNFTCFHNLKYTKTISSAGYNNAKQFPDFQQKYLEGTIDYHPFIPNPNFADVVISLFTIAAINMYRVEYDAERVRRQYFPHLPSRFSALYAFKRYEDCLKAHNLYGWDLKTIRKFRLIPDPLTKVTRANMEIISLMRYAYPRASWSEEGINEIWKHYWAGLGNQIIEIPALKEGKLIRQNCNSGEIWEYLIEGQLVLEES